MKYFCKHNNRNETERHDCQFDSRIGYLSNFVIKNRYSLFLFFSTVTPLPAQVKQKPNIILILADDLGYGDLGCYGQKIIKTPNIDRMAAEGMLFTQHYAGCAVSAPSRSCLMTGQHTGHTFIRGNKEVSPEGQLPLPMNTFTIAKMLKQAGYITGAFGKWGLGYPGSEGDPNNQGFDEFYGYNCQRMSHNYYPYHLWHNQTKVILDGNLGTNNGQYAQDLIHQQAIRFIQDNKNNTFFAFLPYVLPHAELISPDDSIFAEYKNLPPGKSYKGIDGGQANTNGGYSSCSAPHVAYAAMVTRLDTYVGEVMAELKRLGLDRNTLVIFTSDNGPHREGGNDPDFFDSYGSLRGIKRDLYEGGIREPMIAWWPGKINANVKSDLISAFWDLMPTFKQLTGIKLPIKTDGISILPTLISEKGQMYHKYLYWEFHEDGGKIAVRFGKWKGIKLNFNIHPEAPMLLFDLEKDIHEDNNVASQNPNIVNVIDSFMKKARTESSIFKFGVEDKIQ